MSPRVRAGLSLMQLATPSSGPSRNGHAEEGDAGSRGGPCEENRGFVILVHPIDDVWQMLAKDSHEVSSAGRQLVQDQALAEFAIAARLAG